MNFLKRPLETAVVTCLLISLIKVQKLAVIFLKRMIAVLLFLLHLLPFSTADPDTHLHVYFPPEEGQGNSF